MTAWAFGGGRVLGVGVYRGVRRPQFYVRFVVLDVRIIGMLGFLEINFICNFDYKFWCSWSFSTPAMEICSSFSVVLLLN